MTLPALPIPPAESIFARALGDEFERLHPQMQRRFGVSVEVGYACVGTGVMREIHPGPWWVRPFLLLGATRNIMFPESGRGLPFQIDNYAYVDGLGRETVTFVRTMELGQGRRRRFDATMIYSEAAERIIDYLGTHQHLAVDLDLSVTEDGGLRLVSGAQRFYEGWIAFRFPGFLTGRAYLTEYFDDLKQCFVIDLEVRHARLGVLFGYRGEFVCSFPEASQVPGALKPYREEVRE
ncbi:DUF4166 domain-containing protein [Leucobacter sp. G161]|uniref:DUF4166 domain-containing protein n=1 Tax=Leucobacter sp. G161 TaxID=663704 RepID=UPI000B22E459|nr:DUF4166 domain-containing protein [Leucobacter sp. G161]